MRFFFYAPEGDEPNVIRGVMNAALFIVYASGIAVLSVAIWRWFDLNVSLTLQQSINLILMVLAALLQMQIHQQRKINAIVQRQIELLRKRSS